ncbi:MAG: hypothetical protein ACK5GJ_03480 [Planctomycetota bacterium]
MLGKIGFEWFSAHAEGFLKAVGRKPSGVGSSVVFHARTLRKPVDIRITGQLALLRYHLPITGKCNFIKVPILQYWACALPLFMKRLSAICNQ